MAAEDPRHRPLVGRLELVVELLVDPQRISCAIAWTSSPGAIRAKSRMIMPRFLRSARTASATPGYWTLTATSRPSCERRAVDLPDRRGRDRLGVELREQLVERLVELALDHLAHLLEGDRAAPSRGAPRACAETPRGTPPAPGRRRGTTSPGRASSRRPSSSRARRRSARRSRPDGERAPRRWPRRRGRGSRRACRTAGRPDRPPAGRSSPSGPRARSGCAREPSLSAPAGTRATAGRLEAGRPALTGRSSRPASRERCRRNRPAQRTHALWPPS